MAIKNIYRYNCYNHIIVLIRVDKKKYVTQGLKLVY